MKLNFKDWNLIHAALIEKADNIRSNLRWHQDYHKDDENYEPDETEKQYIADIEALTAVINKIESATI